MSSLTNLPDMTYAEAKSKHEELKAIHTVARSMLLEMRDRKGWKALGFTSFEEYGEKEWGYTRQHINRLATAEDVSRSLEPIGSKEIPESQLRPLSQVPEADRQAIWDEALKSVSGDYEKLTAKKVQEAVDEYKRENERLAMQIEQANKTEEQRNQLINQLKAKLSNFDDEKQKAIAAAIKAETVEQQNIISKLRSDITGMKERYEKAVRDGVSNKLREMQGEIDRHQNTINMAESRIKELQNYQADLERTAGKIRQHRTAIEQVKKGLEAVYMALFDIQDDQQWDIPSDIAQDWLNCNKSADAVLSMLDNITCKVRQVERVIDVDEVIV